MMQTKMEKVSLKKQLEEVAKKIDKAYQWQEHLEKSIEESCNIVLNVKVGEEEPPAEKVAKLMLMIKV